MEDFENDVDGDAFLASIDLVCESSTQTPAVGSQKQLELPVFPTLERTSFPGFPYAKPYPQQVELMRSLYASLAGAKCSIIESPTGTGKSLTLLTACLHWLLDHNRSVEGHINGLKKYLQTADANDASSNGDSDWVAAHSRRRARRIQVDSEVAPLEACQKASAKAANIVKEANDIKKEVKSSTRTYAKLSREYASLFPEGQAPTIDEDALDGDPDERRFLVDSDSKLQSGPNEPEVIDESAEDCRVMQIIYCSRTHSQLSQLIDELRKMDDLSSQLTALTLASRQFLCVNEPIYSLKSQALIRDACLDLVGKGSGCKFRSTSAVSDLSDHLLGTRLPAAEAAASIRGSGADIEELPVHACPYYANRRGLPLAQLVLAPYQTVVVPGSREAAGLSLKNNVLIFDEAHNLLEAVAAAFAASISHAELRAAINLLNGYTQYYRQRLSALSVLRLRQLMQVASACLGLLEGDSGGLDAQRRQRLDAENRKPGSSGQEECVYTVPDWLFVAGLDHINFSYLVHYLRTDRCVQKIAGFGKWKGGKRREKSTTSINNEVKRVSSGLSLSDCFEKLKRPPKPAKEEPRSKRQKLDTIKQVSCNYFFGTEE